MFVFQSIIDLNSRFHGCGLEALIGMHSIYISSSRNRNGLLLKLLICFISENHAKRRLFH